MDTATRSRRSTRGWTCGPTSEPRVTEARLIRRVIKPALWVAGLAPLAWLGFTTLTGRLEAEPVKGLEHFTGRTALIILMVALSVTPLRRLTGWNGLIKLRR